MEKRILADQANTLVDLCKVREASGRTNFISHPNQKYNKVASNFPQCLSPLYTDPNTDAKPDV